MDLVEAFKDIPFADATVKAVVARGAAGAVNAAAVRSKERRKVKQSEADIRRRLEEAFAVHAGEVARWSQGHKPPETPAPLDVDDSTVPLDVTEMPRSYTTSGRSTRTLAEDDLLTAGMPLVLTGDPGAGKTTTVKRLCRALLTQPPSSDEDTATYPLLIECRAHDWSKHDLVDLLCDATGFPATEGKRFTALAQYLDDTRAFVFVDGLDEVAYKRGSREIRDRLLNDLRALGNMAQQTHLLVTCRSGSAPDLDNYQTVELCPLTPEQIEQVVRARLGDDTDAFLGQLHDSPILDAATRPLLLSQVITVFQDGNGEMPTMPVNLYSRMVRLLLEDWDRQRRVRRPSTYARFGPDDKKSFLSELSYHLILGGSIRFTTDDLIDVYEKIRQKWELPQNEARRVAKEIETHTGLVVQSGTEWEFSHLSLQEYLCAEHIAKLNDNKLLASYFDAHPEPVAVAAALASEPDAWIANFVMDKPAFQNKQSVRTFVRRLGKERPRFTVSVDLGHAVLRLMMVIADVDIEEFRDLSKIPAVRQSVAKAVVLYEHAKAPNAVSLRPKGPFTDGKRRPKPGQVLRPLWYMMLPDTPPALPQAAGDTG